MQTRQHRLTISKWHTAEEIAQLIHDAEAFIEESINNSSKYTLLLHLLIFIKKHLLEFGRKDKHYLRIYSNIFSLALHLSELNFTQLVIHELNTIPANQKSTLRDTLMPIALEVRKDLLKPEVEKMQDGFMGMAMLGLSTLWFEPKVATGIIIVALIGYIKSESFLESKLEDALMFQLNKLQAHSPIGLFNQKLTTNEESIPFNIKPSQ